MDADGTSAAERRRRRVVELFTQKYTPLMRKVSPVPGRKKKTWIDPILFNQKRKISALHGKI